MSEIKLTKNALREQQKKQDQLQKYLPVLQLKKMMLQEEVQTARLEILALQESLKELVAEVDLFSPLFKDSEAINLDKAAHVIKVIKRIENVAGVEVPYLESVEFSPFHYSLFDTPAWLDAAIVKLQQAARGKEAVIVAEEKKAALEKELRDVSIRVNLFEKILIPKTLAHIKKIKVFLADQDLAQVARAKVAKAKIALRKRGAHAC